MGQSDVIMETFWRTNWELKEDVERLRNLMGTHCGKSPTHPHLPQK
jgi:hypothetical protein